MARLSSERVGLFLLLSRSAGPKGHGIKTTWGCTHDLYDHENCAQRTRDLAFSIWHAESGNMDGGEGMREDDDAEANLVREVSEAGKIYTL